MRSFEARDPIHGFVSFDEWERDIIAHPVFQRLRRIRQLAWTEMVYPGATHTRFEHSLGVMDVATRMFDRIRERRGSVLEELGYNEAGLQRDRILLRMAALLHDVGHSPFSHAGEDVMPVNAATGRRHKHEEYSSALVRQLMRDVIDDHPMNENVGLKADDVAALIEGSSQKARRLFLRQFIIGQLDADRADYLLRDSHHVGVEYGVYDLRRLLVSLTAEVDPASGAPVLAVEEGGRHTAEALIWARYQMFNQVYFHKTRVAYDYHVTGALQHLLARSGAGGQEEGAGVFPAPTSEAALRAYLGWTDWSVLGLLESGGGGEHGAILRERRHHRLVYDTPDIAGPDDSARFRKAREALGDRVALVRTAGNSWYKPESEIMVALDRAGGPRLASLSSISPVIRGLRATNKQLMYVPLEARAEAEAILRGLDMTGEA